MSIILQIKTILIFFLILCSVTRIENTTHHLEFTNIAPITINGQIPKDINGSFYQSTAYSVLRENGSQSCLLDGDGGVFSIKFKDGQALATFKFVKSDTFIEEEKQNMLIYNSMCNLAPNLYNRYFSQLANKSNTKTLPLKNRLLSFYEGGVPFALNSDNLETIGEDNFNGGLRSYNRVLAHTRQDETGIYSVSLGNGLMGRQMNIYKLDKEGNVVLNGHYVSPSRMFTTTHDFLIVGDYIVLINYGAKVNLFKLFFKLEPLGVCLEESLGSNNHILIFNKETLKHVKTIEYERIFSLHFSNGYVEDNLLIFDVVEYDSFEKIKTLFRTTGDPKDDLMGSLFRYEIDMTTWEVKRRNFYKEKCDYPNVKDNQTGKKHSETLALCVKIDESGKKTPALVKLNSNGEEIVKSPIDIDMKKDFASEAIYVKGALKEYIIYMTYFNFSSENAFVKANIKDADTLEDLAILEWDKSIGRGIHAIYSPN